MPELKDFEILLEVEPIDSGGKFRLNIDQIYDWCKDVNKIGTEDIVVMGKLLLRTWIFLHENIEIEGSVQVESAGEARRKREDIVDVTMDVFKKFANGAVGNPTSSDPNQQLPSDERARSHYSEVFSVFLEYYNGCFDEIDNWVDSLMGLHGSGSIIVKHSVKQNQRSRALSLLPIIKITIPILFRDPFVLITKIKTQATYQNPLVPLINGFMKLLLNEITSRNSVSTMLDLSSIQEEKSLFSNENETNEAIQINNSRSNRHQISIVTYVTEWITKTLKNILTDSMFPDEVCVILKDIIALTQHQHMVVCRSQMAPIVLQKIFQILEMNYINPRSHIEHLPSDDDFTAWALLTLRYYDSSSNNSNNNSIISDKSSSHFAYCLRILKRLQSLEDNIIQMRFLSEWTILVCHTSIQEILSLSPNSNENNIDNSSNNNDHIYDISRCTLRLLLQSSLDKDSNINLLNIHDYFASMLVTSLCRTVYQAIRTSSSVIFEFFQYVTTDNNANNNNNNTSKNNEESNSVVQLFPRNDITLESILETIKYPVETQHMWSIFHDHLFASRHIEIVNAFNQNQHAKYNNNDSNNSKNTVHIEQFSEEDQLIIQEAVQYLFKLLNIGMFLINLLSSIIKKASKGNIGEVAPQSLVDLIELTSDILFTNNLGFGHYLSRFPLLRSNIRVITHEFITHIDKILESSFEQRKQTSGGNGNNNGVLELFTPMRKFLAICVKYNHLIMNLSGNNDILQNLLTYFKMHLYQSQITATYLQTIKTQSGLGMLGGGYVADPIELAYYTNNQLFIIDQIVALASTLYKENDNSSVNNNANNHDDYKNSIACLNILRQIKRDFCLSLATITSLQHNGIDLSNTIDSIPFPTNSLIVYEHIEQSIYVIESCFLSASAVEHSKNSNPYEFTTKQVEECMIKLLELAEFDFDYEKLFHINLMYLYYSQDDVRTDDKNDIATTNSNGNNRNNVLPSSSTGFEPTFAPTSTSNNANSSSNGLLDFTPTVAPNGHKSSSNNDIFASFEPTKSSDFKPTSSGDPFASNVVTSKVVTANDPFATTTSTTPANSTTDKQINNNVIIHSRHNINNNSGLSYDTTLDYEQQYGLFTRNNYLYHDSTSKYIASADIFGVIDDIILSHFSYSHANNNEISGSKIDRFSHIKKSASSNNKNTTNIASKSSSALATSASSTTTASTTAVHPSLLHEDEYHLASTIPHDRTWIPLSGSSDVLTVLAYSDCNRLNATMNVTVRVFNSSGFKIPEFSIQLLLLSNCSNYFSNHFNDHENSTITAIFDAKSIRQALGEDYFLPGAYIERVFQFKLLRFASVDVTIRVAYTQLNYDDEDIFQIPLDSDNIDNNDGNNSISNIKNKASRHMSLLQHHSHEGSHYDSYGFMIQGHSTLWNAIIDCMPLHIPISAMLLPYGRGIYSMMKYFNRTRSDCTRYSESRTEGIPYEVFESMWNRLGQHTHRIIPVSGNIPSYILTRVKNNRNNNDNTSVNTPIKSAELILQLLNEYIIKKQNQYGTIGNYNIGMDSKVMELTDRCLSAGWCFQSIWGDEVIVKLTILNDDSDNSSDENNAKVICSSVKTTTTSSTIPASLTWKGKVEIRCYNETILIAILEDLIDFIHDLTGGFVVDL